MQGNRRLGNFHVKKFNSQLNFVINILLFDGSTM